MIPNGPLRAFAKEREHRREIRHREEEDVELLGHARELEDGLGDDPERALAPDEELAQIDAGVVLLERTVELEHLAAHQHHGEPKDPLPRQAIADHLHPAGVGGDVTADVARPLRGEIHRPGQPERRRVLVHGLGDRAGLHAHRAAEDVDRIDPPHARE